MPPIRTDWVEVRAESDIVHARQLVRRLSSEMGFRLVDQTKLVTAASELARNTVVHGGGGRLSWECIAEEGREGIRLTFHDCGPGIADVQLALKDGWSTGKGLGMGLSGTKRLVNEFEIESRPGRGT